MGWATRRKCLPCPRWGISWCPPLEEHIWKWLTQSFESLYNEAGGEGSSAGWGYISKGDKNYIKRDEYKLLLYGVMQSFPQCCCLARLFLMHIRNHMPRDRQTDRDHYTRPCFFNLANCTLLTRMGQLGKETVPTPSTSQCAGKSIWKWGLRCS